MSRYNLEEKENAVISLKEIREKGLTNYNGVILNGVEALIKEIGCSSSTLYEWEKSFDISQKLLEEELEAKHKAKEEVRDTILFDVISEGVEKDDIFGIRFWGWFGKIKGIKNYGSLPIAQLKLKIGLILLQESGLIDMESKNHG